jgi:cytochrome c553
VKRWLVTAALLLAGAGSLGGLAAVAGVIPIAASSGHFAITEWLLVFTKERSVNTHSLGLDLPSLDDPVLVLKGAGQYEAACRPCHGAPDLPRPPRVPQAMLPPPPNLSERAAEYEPRELFYIVKNGIKFTGMPAWPSLVRDDEVSAMVAFLVALPELDGTGYRQLVHGDAAGAQPSLALRSSGARPVPADGRTFPPASAASASEPLRALAFGEGAPRAVITSCGRCHGVDGRGRGNAAFPALAGQSQAYLLAALEAYASDRRQSGIMQPSAAALTGEEMHEVTEYYSRLSRGPAHGAARDLDSGAVARGRSISDRGVPERRVPSCSDCHGPGSGPRSPAAPLLAGQYAGYLVLQLQLFADEHRGGSDHAHLMGAVAPHLTREQMADVAQYYASLATP